MIFASKASAKRRVRDAMFRWLCQVAVGTSVAILLALLGKLGYDGYHNLSWRFLVNAPSMSSGKTGILYPLVGSLLVMAITAIVVVPVGVGAAVWLQEFNTRKNRLSEFIQLTISNLAGVPSIVFGILGLAIFVRGMGMGRSLIAGGLTMSILILPMVIIVSQEALKAVPNTYREGSLALGATRWQTISRQVLPCAMPGILTGLILSLSRAIGETAPLIVVGAAGFVTYLPRDLKDGYMVLPLQIYSWSRNPNAQVNANAASAILLLMVLLIGMNSVAIVLRARAAKMRQV